MSLKHILFLHGALGSSASFTDLIPLFSSHFQSHVLDFSGHGSKSGNTFSMSDLVNDVLNYVQQNQLETYSIFGYSMGGYVALNAALFDSKIERIVCLGTKFDWSPEIAEREIKQLNPEIIQEKVPHFAANLATLHGESNWKDVLTYTAEFMTDLGNKNLIGNSAWSELEIPVLILRANEDKMISENESVSVVNLLKNAKFDQISGKHPLETLDKSQLAELVIPFFTQL
jgi:pimeloyl-ACP methyl ester carboxylesterase